MRPSPSDAWSASQPTCRVCWRRSWPSSSIDQTFIVSSRSLRKYTRPFQHIGDLLVPG
ncbi:MAG TPA: hypothetical protein VGG39_15265 [Polyangiaceae bacterium]